MAPKMRAPKRRGADADLYAQEAAAAQIEPAVGPGHVDNLHAQIAHVVPRPIVELVAHIVEVGGVDPKEELSAKDQRLAGQLIRSGYLSRAMGRIVVTADGAKLVGAFVAAGWIR